MKMIRPMTVNDAALAYSSVAEDDHTAWSAVITYAAGERVRWVADDSHRTYESIIAGNLNNAPEAVSTTLVLVGIGTRLFDVATGLGLAGGQAVKITDLADSSNTLTGTINSYNSGTGALSIDVSTVTGGGQSASWVIKLPEVWLEIGATNRWLMFDRSVTSQTTASDSLSITVIADGRVDSIVLLNISASSVTITATDAVDGEIYNHTDNLAATSGITDWYAYFFEPVIRRTDYFVGDLPPYSGATITITLGDSGETVACGAAVLGIGKELGGTQYGMSLGIQDYSIKERDAFGNYTIRQRAFSKRQKLTMQVENTLVDSIQTLLASYRATPVVYVGADDFGSSVIYGFYKDFQIVVSYPTVSICDIEIEGLT